jgi:hypothetical protein
MHAAEIGFHCLANVILLDFVWTAKFGVVQNYGKGMAWDSLT